MTVASALELERVDPAETEYRSERQRHWDYVAALRDRHQSWGRGYHERLRAVFQSVVLPGQRVLEIGCGNGDLLASLLPSFGVGVDLSGAMVARARRRHPSLHFVQADAHRLPTFQHAFDVVVLSDLVNDVWDVQKLLENVAGVARPGSRIVLNVYSRLWEWPLRLAARAGLMTPVLLQNWLTPDDLGNLLRLAGLEPVNRWSEVLCPVRVPVLGPFLNRVAVKLWPIRWFALSNFVVARPTPRAVDARSVRVSVVVPARNEAGNIADVFARTPEMGAGTELVFVEGHSRDDTYGAVERAIAREPRRRAALLRQEGIGKGDAVRAGFARATGDVLMILDADLTVPPEDLPRFLDALVEGRGEFINGVRLVYPMEGEAMRFVNLLGNKFFSLAFSWVLGQPIKDTLCGTKVLWARDYERIARQRTYFGDFDPFGDFELLFGAARLRLKIVDVPVRYRARRYGTTNISRWKHGWLLLRMVTFATRRLKFA